MIYDRFGNKINDDGTPINTPLSGSLPDLANETVNPSMVSGGASKNFKTGEAGWIIRNDGSFELGAGSFRGIITIGTPGTTAGLSLNGNNGTIIVNDGTNDRVLIGYLAGKF